MTIRATLVLSSALSVAACASAPVGSNPGDMSASEHKRHARMHTAEANDHAEKFKPGARNWSVRVGVNDEFETLPDYYTTPTQQHLRHAEHHLDVAHAHAEAAHVLEAFEIAQCQAFAPKTRTMCPLLSAVTEVEDTAQGVRFRVAAGVEPAGLVAHMRCHFAVGRKTGQDAMPHCPLYLPELRIEQTSPGIVELTTTDAKARVPLRDRLHAHEMK